MFEQGHKCGTMLEQLSVGNLLGLKEKVGKKRELVQSRRDIHCLTVIIT